MSLMGGFVLAIIILAACAIVDFAKIQFESRSMYTMAKSSAYYALHSEQDIFAILQDDPTQLVNYQDTTESGIDQLLLNTNLDVEHEVIFGKIEQTQSGYQFTAFVSQNKPLIENPTAAVVVLTKHTIYGTTQKEKAIYAFNNTNNGGACWQRYQECLNDGKSEAYCRYGHISKIDSTLGNPISQYPYLGLLHNRTLGQNILQTSSTNNSALLSLTLADLNNLTLSVLGGSPLAVYHNHNFTPMKANYIPEWISENNWHSLNQINTAEIAQYSCEQLNLLGLVGLYSNCTKWDGNDEVVFSGDLYLGYESTCIDTAASLGKDVTSCLSTSHIMTHHSYPDDFEDRLDTGGDLHDQLTVSDHHHDYVLSSCLTINADVDEAFVPTGTGATRGLFLPRSIIDNY